MKRSILYLSMSIVLIVSVFQHVFSQGTLDNPYVCIWLKNNERIEIPFEILDSINFISNRVLEIETLPMEMIYATKTVCQFSIMSNDDIALVDCGICYATKPNPTVDDSFSSSDKKDGLVSVSLDGLSPATKYYYRTYARYKDKGDEIQILYGTMCSFTTMKKTTTFEIHHDGRVITKDTTVNVSRLYDNPYGCEIIFECMIRNTDEKYHEYSIEEERQFDFKKYCTMMAVNKLRSAL